MIEKSCWYCDKPIYLDEEHQYCDIDCPNCGVQNSFHNPDDYEPIPPEEIN